MERNGRSCALTERRTGLTGRLNSPTTIRIPCVGSIPRMIAIPAAGIGDYSYLNNLGLCGCFWSSIPALDSLDCAWGPYFDSSGFSHGDGGGRHFGLSVRPIREFAK